MDLELEGRAFLVTGGTDGLGLALAHRLVEEGAVVAICGRDASRLESAEAGLPSAQVFAARVDVTDGRALDGFVDAAAERFGRLDGVVSNAGRAVAEPVVAATDEQWQDDFELKVLAAVRLARRSVPYLERQGGSILNVLAIKAKAPDAGSTPTSASRAAGLALTKALAGELGPRGIRVNAVLIGLVESGQWVRRAESTNTDLATFYATMAQHFSIPLGRVGRAGEFADLAAYLLSERASYVTGVGINLDGGLSPVV
jgi:NAD(P)-dependent dehydrogenase (short-subunit alcohol dehydrogenase family)